LYKLLVKTSPDALAIGDLNNTIIDASHQLLEMFGYKDVKELIGKDSYLLVAPEDREYARMNVAHLQKQCVKKSVEITLIKKDGTHLIGEVDGALIKDTSGKPKTIIPIVRDISERKKAEEELKRYREHLEELVKERTAELAKLNEQLERELEKRKKVEKELRESEELYKLIVRMSPDAINVYDLDANLIEVSPRMVELAGYEKAEEMLGMNGFEFLLPKEKVNRIYKKVLKNKSIRNTEIIGTKKDGTTFIAEVNASQLNDTYGKPKYIVAIIKDISERKRMENVLRASETKLKQEVKSLRKQIQQSHSYPKMIGNSPKFLQVIDLVRQVARTDSTVLIYGETDSGKDLIAQAIHYNSSRKEGPFIPINCAAIPEQLIESELFGYAKGAFTGAFQNKKGLFEEADKGTIFLNEISEMPLKVQAKLLQVLENQQMRRLGQSKSIRVDVRIIAASNKDLEDAIKKRRFREDLFYRLNIFPIHIPPLRERKEDIPLMIQHFLDFYCPLMNKKIINSSAEAMDILCTYDYPGNVRELENIIQRSVIMVQDSILLPSHLPEKLRSAKTTTAPDTIGEMERQMLETAIQKYKGDLRKAKEDKIFLAIPHQFYYWHIFCRINIVYLWIVIQLWMLMWMFVNITNKEIRSCYVLRCGA
jgi:PAS domain S-box-containing protein